MRECDNGCRHDQECLLIPVGSRRRSDDRACGSLDEKRPVGLVAVSSPLPLAAVTSKIRARLSLRVPRACRRSEAR